MWKSQDDEPEADEVSEADAEPEPVRDEPVKPVPVQAASAQGGPFTSEGRYVLLHGAKVERHETATEAAGRAAHLNATFGT